jgi:hypothetical protein
LNAEAFLKPDRTGLTWGGDGYITPGAPIENGGDSVVDMMLGISNSAIGQARGISSAAVGQANNISDRSVGMANNISDSSIDQNTVIPS